MPLSTDRSGRILACGRTDTGRRRTNNEDAWIACDVVARTSVDAGDVCELDPRRALLFAVCDGMGGVSGGEIASAMVIDTLREVVPEMLADRPPEVALEQAIQVANARVRDASRAPGREGMGSTLTAALIQPPVALIAQVGDSRAYVLRRGRLAQVTRDQSYLGYLIESGIHPEAAASVAPQHVILQAVGQRESLTIPVTRLELRAGDILLLCTDGLSTEVDDEAIAAILAGAGSLTSRRERLIAAANARGGRDNITSVLIECLGDDFPVATSDESVSSTFRAAHPEPRIVQPEED